MTTTTSETMTAQHVEALLALLVSLDPRLRAPDPGTAEIRVSAWTSLLAEVPPTFAVRFAERAYQEVRDWPLVPAEILTAWREEQRETAQAQGEALFGDDRYRQRRSGWSAEVVDYCLAVMAAVQAGLPAESVERPVLPERHLTPAQEAWQRRCTFHTICACDHTRCRDGWLDVEETTEALFGTYPVVVRCPHCEDATRMAVEQGLAKKPSQRPRRRAS
jgi:hypothetical protein